MSKTYLSIELGGKLRGLNYKMGAKHEIVRLQQERGDLALLGEADNLSIVIEAGLVCNDTISGNAADWTTEDVKRWVYEMEPEQAKEITDFFTNAYGLAGGGEGGAQ